MQLVAVKPMGALGRIVIPNEVRQSWNMQPGTEIGIYIDNGKIILKALSDKDTCFICNEKAVRTIKGKYICEECIEVIKEEGEQWQK